MNPTLISCSSVGLIQIFLPEDPGYCISEGTDTAADRAGVVPHEVPDKLLCFTA